MKAMDNFQTYVRKSNDWTFENYDSKIKKKPQELCRFFMNVANTAKGIFLDKRLIQQKNEVLVDKNVSGKSFQAKHEDKNNRK